jgi:hypothetical protein
MRVVTPIGAALVVLGCCLVPSASPAGNTGTETIVVNPSMTMDPGPRTDTDFITGKRYQAVLSGTITIQNANGNTYSYDPIYCYAGPFCEDKDAGSGMLKVKDAAHPVPVAIMALGRPTTPSTSSPGNPAYRDDHTYTVVLDRASGPLEFSAPPWGRGDGPDVSSATGAFTVAITPIDEISHSCVARVLKAPKPRGVSMRLTQSSKHAVSAMRVVGKIGKAIPLHASVHANELNAARGRLCHKDQSDAGDQMTTLDVVDVPDNRVGEGDAGTVLEIHVKVVRTDDDSCAVGTLGSVIVRDSGGRGSDLLKIAMGRECESQSHSYRGSARASITAAFPEPAKR